MGEDCAGIVVAPQSSSLRFIMGSICRIVRSTVHRLHKESEAC